MYKAKLINKTEDELGRVEVTVEYSNGVDTKTETFKPQDKAGYFHIVNSTLASLNSLADFKAENNVGKEIVTENTNPDEPTPLDTWRQDFFRLNSLVRLKTVVEAGCGQLKPAQQTALVNLAAKVLKDFQSDYIGKF